MVLSGVYFFTCPQIGSGVVLLALANEKARLEAGLCKNGWLGAEMAQSGISLSGGLSIRGE